MKLFKHDVHENAEIIKVYMHYILVESNTVTMVWGAGNCLLFFSCTNKYVSPSLTKCN